MKKKFKNPIVIVGGGPTGLGAAYMLRQCGYDDWLLYERDDEVGGLSRSFKDEHGFTWDVGGHVVFSHYGLFDRLLDALLGKDGWLYHERESYVRVMKRWTPYPFQNNIHHLPPKEKARCLDGLIKAALIPSKKAFRNFDEFIAGTFGDGMCEIFMRPYNRKTWAYDLDKLDSGWIAERVSVPDPTRVARNVSLKRDDVDWGPNNRFRFPKVGGTGAIWTKMAQTLPSDHIFKNHEVAELDTKRKIIRFSNGVTQRYGALISTMPLDCLALISRRKDWIELTSKLLHSSVYVIGVGLKDKPSPEIRTKCWMYFPENTTPFYRVTHFSHYSPNNAGDIKSNWSLMAEVSESPQKPVDVSKLAENTIKGLTTEGLIKGPEQVIHTWIHRVEYGYPTPAIGRDDIINCMLPQLEELGILSRGRFGAWLYEVGNMDHSFIQGWEAAGHLILGIPEFTLWRPHVVNQSHPVLGWNLYR
jgi:protoporphyrinogen oxidase